MHTCNWARRALPWSSAGPVVVLVLLASAGCSHKGADAKSGVHYRPGPPHVETVAFAPGGKLLAAGLGHNARLWAMPGKTPAADCKGNEGNITCLAFSPDGKQVATSGADQSVRIFDTATGKELHQMKHNTFVQAVAWSPDGKTLASSAYLITPARTVLELKLWDAQNGTLLADLPGVVGGLNCLAFTRDSKLLLAAGKPAEIKAYDVASRKPSSAVKVHTDSITAMAFTPPGKQLVVATKMPSVEIYDTSNWKQQLKAEVKDFIHAVAISKNGQVVACGSEDGTISLWDLATQKQTGTIQTDAGPVLSVAFGADDNVLASGAMDGKVRLWDTGSHHVVDTLK